MEDQGGGGDYSYPGERYWWLGPSGNNRRRAVGSDSGCILKIEQTEFADTLDGGGEGKGVKGGFTGFHLSLGRRELPLEAGRLWIE